MSYTVVWSKYDSKEMGPVQHYKKFENKESAKWFAKEMEKCYNWSICVNTRLLEEL